MKYIIAIFILLAAHDIFAYRISTPPTLNYPITEEQVKALNKYLSDVSNLTNGLYEMDVVTTTKTNAQQVEFWIVETGSVSTVQFKNNGHIYTVNSF